MDNLLVKLIAIASILVVPLVFVAIFWKRLNLTVKIGTVGAIGIAAFAVYPLLTFAWALQKVGASFPDDCRTTVQYSRYYLERPYSRLHSDWIGRLLGSTPKDYFLSMIAICKYRLGDMDEAVKSLEELVAHASASPYDRHSLDDYKTLLAKAKQKLTEHQQDSR